MAAVFLNERCTNLYGYRDLRPCPYYIAPTGLKKSLQYIVDNL